MRILVLLLIGPAAFGLYHGVKLGRQFMKLPLFDIKYIECSGRRRLSESDILKLASIQSLNYFDLNTQAVAQRLLSHPYIYQAAVDKIFPDTICIKITERKPWALVNCGDLYLVDKKGVVLENLQDKPRSGMTIITGGDEKLEEGKSISSPGLKNGLELMEELEKAGLLPDISEINIKQPDFPKIYTLSDDIEIWLAQEKIKERLKQLQQVREDLHARIKEVEVLDLRSAENVIINRE